jgi:hypothetical protein
VVDLINDELAGSDEDDFELYMPQWRSQELQKIFNIEGPEVKRLRFTERHNQLVRTLHGRCGEQHDEEHQHHHEKPHQHPREEPHQHHLEQSRQHHQEELHQHHHDDLHQHPDEHDDESDNQESQNSIEMVDANPDIQTECWDGPSPKRPRLRIQGTPCPTLIKFFQLRGTCFSLYNCKRMVHTNTKDHEQSLGKDGLHHACGVFLNGQWIQCAA